MSVIAREAHVRASSFIELSTDFFFGSFRFVLSEGRLGVGGRRNLPKVGLPMKFNISEFVEIGKLQVIGVSNSDSNGFVVVNNSLVFAGWQGCKQLVDMSVVVRELSRLMRECI